MNHRERSKGLSPSPIETPAMASRAPELAVAMVIATATLSVGCEPADEPGRSPETASDSVMAATPSEEPLAQRQGPQSPPSRELRTELEGLLRGPSTESGAPDTSSWFSTETADALRSVTVDSTGHATVDFHDLRPLIPNASSSAGSTLLLDELNSAVFRVPGIRSVEYRMEGSCDRFWEWLQYACQTVTRASTAG